MKWHRTITVGVLLATATACSTNTAGNDTASTTAPAVAAPSLAPVASTSVPVESAPTVTDAPTPTDTAAVLATTSRSAASVEVVVSGGALPTAVASAVTSNGGELVDTAEWDARYGLVGLPIVAGPGVRLVGAEMVSRSLSGG